MSIDPSSLSGVATTDDFQTSSTTGSSTFEDKEQFLQLVLTQLQHQDPLEPADTNQFANQMMQMGSLEQLMNLNTNMETLAAAQQGSMISQYSGIVGKSVFATGNVFEHSAAEGGTLQFKVSSTPETVKVHVFDQFDNLVRTIDNTGITASGTHTINFDGLDNQGQPLTDGYYKYTVEANDSDDNPITTTTYSSGRVSSIRLEGGTPIFQMGNEDVPVENIEKIF